MWANPELAELNHDDIHYFVRAGEKPQTDWDAVPAEIKNTFEKLGIPEAERKFLAGVGAQYKYRIRTADNQHGDGQWVDRAVTLVRGHRVPPTWGRTRDDWVVWFADKDVAFAPVLDFREALDQPHVAAAMQELRAVCAFFKLLGTYPIDVH